MKGGNTNSSSDTPKGEATQAHNPPSGGKGCEADPAPRPLIDADGEDPEGKPPPAAATAPKRPPCGGGKMWVRLRSQRQRRWLSGGQFRWINLAGYGCTNSAPLAEQVTHTKSFVCVLCEVYCAQGTQRPTHTGNVCAVADRLLDIRTLFHQDADGLSCPGEKNPM